MKRTLLLALVFVVFGSACGGDESEGPLVVDAPGYAQALVVADSNFWRDGSEIVGTFARAGADTVSAERAFATFALLLGRYSDTLGLVEPPIDLQPSHREYVNALGALALTFADAGDGLSDISVADILEEDPGLSDTLNEGNDRVAAACVAVQEAVAAAGQSITLRCDDFS